MESSLAVVGTLIGTVVGAVGAYLSQSVNHRREVGERLLSVRRDAQVEWLLRTHELYLKVRSVVRAHRDVGGAPDDLQSRLVAVPAEGAQHALEMLRLVAADATVNAAADLWTHLRRDRVALGEVVNARDWQAWQDRYWKLRRAFIDAARREAGSPPLDWAAAGVGPVR